MVLLLKHNKALKILSLKVNGLRQKFTQDIIFSRSGNLGFDVVFLQEIYVANIVEASQFSKLWEGMIFWSFGTTKSYGVGILLNKNLSFKLVSQARDTDGRLLWLDINLADRKYCLINVHNDAANRKQFINDLEGYMITPLVFIF